jgi:hypothetical protein
MRRPRKLAVYLDVPLPRKAPYETLKRDPSDPNLNCVQARANQRQPVDLSALLQACHGASRYVPIALFAPALVSTTFFR